MYNLRYVLTKHRIDSHCTSLFDKKAQSGAFQLFSAVSSKMTSKIPTSLSFTDAAVLPLALFVKSLLQKFPHLLFLRKRRIFEQHSDVC